MAYEIQTGIPRPFDIPKRGGANHKYPFASLQPGQYFIVPQTEKEAGQTDKRFRDRINQACRTYTTKVNKEAHLQEGYKEDDYTPVSFSVLTLGAPPKEHPGAWVAGDVGVWRDN